MFQCMAGKPSKLYHTLQVDNNPKDTQIFTGLRKLLRLRLGFHWRR